MDSLPTLQPRPHTKAMSRRLVLCLVASVALPLSGCSSMDVNKALPEFKRPVKPAVDRSIRVAPVQGPPAAFGTKLTNELMREALEAALKASGLYSSVGTRDNTDLELRATILSTQVTKWRQPFFSMEFRRELMVAYEVLEVATGRSLLRETYRSEAGSTISGGNEANNEATEIGLRENLRLLFETLGERLPGATR